MSTTLRAALTQDSPLIGTIMTTSCPEIAEALVLMGFDWIFLDLEHGSLSIREAQVAVQAVANRCHTVLRIPDGTPENLKRALDTGCNGIIVPLVNSESYARRLVSLSRYPPLGERSVGLGRAQGFGLRFLEYLQTANDEVAIILQIEHREALSELEKILAVPGFDAILLGPYDLSGSLGVLGQVSEPRVRTAIDQVRMGCLNAKIPFGIYCSTTDLAVSEIRAGAKLIAVATDILHMAHSAKASLQTLRQ